MNHMKAGLATADRLLTVSPGESSYGGRDGKPRNRDSAHRSAAGSRPLEGPVSSDLTRSFIPPAHPRAARPNLNIGYSDEITTYLGGWGMEGLLGARKPVLSGIVNGIDMDE
jgi:hypothetical protein